MPSKSEIREQVEQESERRGRLAVPAFAGGFLYLLSAIIIASTLSSLPTVGVIQGLRPAFQGSLEAATSPRTDEVKFISHHALALIAGSVMAAIAIGALVLVLLLLLDATRFRRPNVWPYARPLILFGGGAVAFVSIAHQVVGAIQTHNFAVGSDHSHEAVENALTKGTANQVVQYIALLAGLALAVGLIVTMVNALRVGLIPRWMMIIGCFTAILIVLPLGSAELQLVPAFWMVMMGILYAGRWPNENEPAAWAAGEARPWPSAAEQRAARQAGAGRPAAATAAAGTDVSPAPSTTGSTGARSRKRRKRGGRN
jgi:hypothetical protein